jgi:DNA-binding SARP family transcriptional activator/WD40 repeat protein
MRCGVLGPLEVHDDDGARISVPGAKERLLLAVLAAESPHVVGVDRLVDELWNGEPPRTAVKSLQAHVVRLRSALEPDRPPGSPGRYVVRRQSGYALALEDGGLDVRRFTELSARGRALLSSGEPTLAVEALSGALALWRGAPYADWPDADFAVGERSRLEAVRSNTRGWWLEARLALGQHLDVVPELQRLTAEQPTDERWWAMLALALYRAGRQGDALAAVRDARSTLAEELGVDPGPDLSRIEEGILRQDPALDLAPGTAARHPEPGGSAVVTGCPFKGLAAYQFEDRAVFRGRDRLVSRLIGALVDSPLLVVAGSSGVGKSSLVRAGLLPALADDALPGSRAWAAVVTTPGPRPVDALARLLADDPQPPRVLVCDQLEELWSPVVDAAERSAFLDSVLGLVDDGAVARCVLVVRGDHVGRLAEHASMAERMVGALTLVAPPEDAELREVVEGPAATAGLSVEPDLVEAVLRDVVGRPGALPLLSAALVGTWERRRGSLLTLAGYLEAGGVAGAVAATAEAAYASFDAEEQEAARQVLVRLAEQDDGGGLRRRRMSLVEIAPAGDPQTTHHRVVEALAGRRLLTLDGDHVEVAHEALLVAWPRLVRWLEDDSVGRAVRRRLAPDALEWERDGRPGEQLYRGARLQAVADWIDDPGSGATAVERAFVAAARDQAEQALREARAWAETEAAARRRTRRLATGLAAVLVLALAATVVAVVFQRSADRRAAEAETARTIADANRLAAQSTGARSLDLSLLLAANALRTAVTPATEDGLLNGLLVHRRAIEVHSVPTGVEEMSLSMDGRTGYATVGGATPRVVSWQIGEASASRLLVNWLPDSISAAPDGRSVAAAGVFEGAWTSYVGTEPYLAVFARDGEVLREWAGFDALGGIPRKVSFTPAGELRVVTSAVDKNSQMVGTLREVDVASGRVRVIRQLGRTPGKDALLASSFTPDASRVVTWRDGDHTQVRLYDVRRDRLTRVRLGHRNAATLDFVALPDGVMQLWSDGAMTRYDVRGRAVQTMSVHSPPVGGVFVLPDGRRAVTVGGQGEVWLWTIQSDGEWTAIEQLPGHTGNVYLAAAGRENGRVMTAAEDGTLIGWDLDGAAGFGSPYPDLGERWISNRMEVVDSGRLVVAPARSLDRTVETANRVPLDAVFLDPRTGEEQATVPVGSTRAQPFLGGSVSVSPDASLVAVTTIWRTKIIDVQSREVVATIKLPLLPPAYLAELPDAAVWASAWSPDGSRLLLGTLGSSAPPSRHTALGDLMVVDTTSWRVERRVVVPGGIRVLEWSPDRTILAVGQEHIASVTLFDSSLRRQRVVALRPSDYPIDLAFSSDGSRLAVGGAEGRVSVLDTDRWELVHEPALVQGARIVDVGWLPDGRTVVTSGADERASLYDSTRNLVRAGPFSASDQPPDGQGYAYVVPGAEDELVLAGGDQPGRRIPLEPAVWLATACRIAGRDLTRDEWRTYLPDTPYRRTCAEILGP